MVLSSRAVGAVGHADVVDGHVDKTLISLLSLTYCHKYCAYIERAGHGRLNFALAMKSYFRVFIVAA